MDHMNRYHGRNEMNKLTMLVTCLLVVCNVGFASDPNVSVRMKNGERALIEDFRGGDQTGYGTSRLYSVASTAASTDTTMVSSLGMYKVDYVNIGSNTVYISTNGTTVTTANCQLILPAGMSFSDKTKVAVSKIYYYTPATGATSSLVIT